VAIKLDKLYRKIARDRYEAYTQFNNETAREALTKRWASDEGEIRGASADAGRIQSEFQRAEAAIAQEPELKSSQQLAEDFDVSSSTIERVRTILDQGTQADPISEEQKRDS
jgi:hypothetical protein